MQTQRVMSKLIATAIANLGRPAGLGSPRSQKPTGSRPPIATGNLASGAGGGAGGGGRRRRPGGGAARQTRRAQWLSQSIRFYQVEPRWWQGLAPIDVGAAPGNERRSTSSPGLPPAARSSGRSLLPLRCARFRRAADYGRPEVRRPSCRRAAADSKPNGRPSRHLADVSAAERDLGFRTEIGLEDGLRELVEWWQPRRGDRGRPAGDGVVSTREVLDGSLPEIAMARPWFGEEEAEAVREVVRSGWVSQGAKVVEFERAVAEATSARHAVAVSNCTTALHLGMVVAGLRPGDEVVVPSLSFIATANAVRYVGATPVFVDVDPSPTTSPPRPLRRPSPERPEPSSPSTRAGAGGHRRATRAVRPARVTRRGGRGVCHRVEYQGRAGRPRRRPRRLLLPPPQGPGDWRGRDDHDHARRLGAAPTAAARPRHEREPVRPAQLRQARRRGVPRDRLQLPHDRHAGRLGLVQLDKLDDMVERRRARRVLHHRPPRHPGHRAGRRPAVRHRPTPVLLGGAAG